jgi:hypothetical protein
MRNDQGSSLYIANPVDSPNRDTTWTVGTIWNIAAAAKRTAR